MAPLRQPRTLPARFHVLLIVEESIAHCFRYRVKQKIEQLELSGYEARWISWKDQIGVRQALHFSHVVIFYRVPAFDEVANTIEYARALNKVVLYDIDDLIFDQKIMEENIDQGFARELSREETSALLTGTGLYSRAISASPYTIGSTPALCDELARFGGKVYLHRNALDEAILDYVNKGSPKIGRDAVTIFYGSGTKTHDGDFEIAAPSLLRLLESYTDVRLTVVGFLNLPKEFKVYADRIDRIAPLSTRSYWEFLKNADMNIAPLRPGVFSDCKSEIKWLEAAVMKVPSVVSDSRTYREVLRDGENVYIASSSEEWYAKLTSLVEDLGLRERIRQNAYDYACANYRPEAAARNLDEIIQDALAKEAGRSVAIPAPRQKRIVYVNVLYPPHDLGGATVVAKNHIDIIQEMYGNRFEPAVFAGNITPGVEYHITEYEHEGTHVTSIRLPLVSDIDWRYCDEQIYELFRRYLECQQPDLIHFHSVQRLTASVLEAARECGIPYLVTLHDSWWLCDRQFMIDNLGQDCSQFRADPLVCAGCVDDSDKSLERRSYLREQLIHARLLLAVSRYQQELYKRNGFDHVVLNRNGVHKNAQVQRKPHTGKLRMGYLGGICVHKGYYFFKEVLENLDLKQSEVTVVDFGMSSGNFRREMWGSTPVRFVSKIQSEDMPRFYGNLDVLVVPSLWRESFGLVVREALVNGVWVVAADAGGLAEDIRHGMNGHIFRKGSTDELAAILREIDRDANTYQSRAGTDASHIRSVEEQVEELISIYDKVLDGD
jgi:glycosyltransferase involved in cell wall biosynthesis